MVGTAQRSPNTLFEVQHLLQEAHAHLGAGACDEARRYARDTRDEIIEAREQATHGAVFRPTIP